MWDTEMHALNMKHDAKRNTYLMMLKFSEYQHLWHLEKPTFYQQLRDSLW